MNISAKISFYFSYKGQSYSEDRMGAIKYFFVPILKGVFLKYGYKREYVQSDFPLDKENSEIIAQLFLHLHHSLPTKNEKKLHWKYIANL